MSVTKIRVYAVTTGAIQPGSRFRWQQHIPTLVESGIEPVEAYVRWGAYPPRNKFIRPFWLAANAASAVSTAYKSNEYDIRFLQRGMISTLSTGELLMRKPIVLDVDDAIFLKQRFGGVDRIARRASLTICGNSFLGEYFSRFGKTTILPTAVNTRKFVPSEHRSSRPTIGWAGTSSGFPYLYEIEPALKIVLARFPDAQLRVVAERPPLFSQIPAERVIFQRWGADTEVDCIHDLTVGIMPLTDGKWERGKCSFKMLTYMAVGVPVVVAAVGMNLDVFAKGTPGYLARTRDEWVDAISNLLTNTQEGLTMGNAGRQIVEQHYSAEIIGRQLAAILREQA